MTELTDLQKWEAILVRCGFQLVDDIDEFASKTCPLTLDNLFKIGVNGLREKDSYISFWSYIIPAYKENPPEYGFGAKVVKYGEFEDNLEAFNNSDPAKTLLGALYKAWE